MLTWFIPPARRVATSRATLILALMLFGCGESEPKAFERRPVLATRILEAHAALPAELTDQAMWERNSSLQNLDILQHSPDASERNLAARIAGFPGLEWATPRLLARLDKEHDTETLINICRSLAHHGNWAGVDKLYVLINDGLELPLYESASAALDEIALDSGIGDATELWRLWNDGDMDERLPFTRPSPRHRLLIWENIAQLAKTDFEEARFVLSNSHAWVAGLLAAALHDENKVLASRAAECLEGMGPRGNIAGPDLVLALNAEWLAPQAAAALGRVAYPLAGPELARCLGADRDLELRVAAAHALGTLGLPGTVSALEKALDETEPSILRSAAAAALIEMEAGQAAVYVALELLRAAGGSTAEAEEALGIWLERRAKDGYETSRAALERWNARVTPPSIEPTPAELATRRTQRAAAIESLLKGSAQE